MYRHLDQRLGMALTKVRFSSKRNEINLDVELIKHYMTWVNKYSHFATCHKFFSTAFEKLSSSVRQIYIENQNVTKKTKM